MSSNVISLADWRATKTAQEPASTPPVPAPILSALEEEFEPLEGGIGRLKHNAFLEAQDVMFQGEAHSPLTELQKKKQAILAARMLENSKRRILDEIAKEFPDLQNEHY